MQEQPGHPTPYIQEEHHDHPPNLVPASLQPTEPIRNAPTAHPNHAKASCKASLRLFVLFCFVPPPSLGRKI